MEDISAVYSHPDGKWGISGYAKNIFNYAEKRSYGPDHNQMAIGDPRTHGAFLSVRY